MFTRKFAVVVPMANEAQEFELFVNEMTMVLDRLHCGVVYLVVDTVSKDKTLNLCQELSKRDSRFITVWAPENRNVVDAYLRGYREALLGGSEIIIEMDAGLSHDPRALPMFLRVLNEGNECAFGSRFINGGSIFASTWRRTFLSRAGTLLANVLLGTRMRDMTSGFQGFHAGIVKKFVDYPLLSTAHFYQTELRYLLRHTRFAEIPIHYRAPSPSVSQNAVSNALAVLWHYFLKRLRLQAVSIQ
jgi:dolichol-phosphate mannosyltransferase